MFILVCLFSLQETLMDETRLYLIFEFLSMDLKKYLDSIESGKFMEPALVKSYLYQVKFISVFFYTVTPS